MEKKSSLIKKVFIGMIALIAILSVAYIFLVYLATPKDAVVNVLNGAKHGDMGKISRNATDKATGYFSMAALRSCSADRKSYDKDHQIDLFNVCLLEKYKNIEIKSIEIKTISENEADADVMLQEGLDTYSTKFKVLKINDQWKVHIDY